ncbi:DUF4192 domain-containing protein [Micromonospora sp. NPDC049903]|uniref:DUF4192 domain-containing protein n=1 Tax=Micromonospora sp. NPDC049903 TaxID=3364276 RepID=UPI003794A15E
MTAVPYLLGFRPAVGSIVVVAHHEQQIAFVARADLPTPGSPDDHLHALTDHLAGTLAQQECLIDLMIIGYGTATHIDAPLHAVAAKLAEGGMTTRELIRVTDNRSFSLTCDKPLCCPPEGIPFDPTSSLTAVQATAAGLVALPDRADVAARIAPQTGPAADRMRHATTEAAARLHSHTDGADMHERGVRAVQEALHRHDDGHGLADNQVASLALLLTRRSVRDAAAGLTAPHETHVTLWADITRRVEQSLVPAPATVLAITAWRCGDGVLAVMAAERALDIDPTNELAALVLQALHAGLPPTVVEQAFTDHTDPPRN